MHTYTHIPMIIELQRKKSSVQFKETVKSKLDAMTQRKRKQWPLLFSAATKSVACHNVTPVVAGSAFPQLKLAHQLHPHLERSDLATVIH